MVMNHRPMSGDTCAGVFNSVLQKIDKAGSKETFYLAMALGRGLNRKFQPDMVPKFSDLVYALYIQAAQHIATYDLYQLGQLSMFLGSPAATDYVPVEFWTENLEKALEDNLMNYQKYRDQLDA